MGRKNRWSVGLLLAGFLAASPGWADEAPHQRVAASGPQAVIWAVNLAGDWVPWGSGGWSGSASPSLRVSWGAADLGLSRSVTWVAPRTGPTQGRWGPWAGQAGLGLEGEAWRLHSRAGLAWDGTSWSGWTAGLGFTWTEDPSLLGVSVDTAGEAGRGPGRWQGGFTYQEVANDHLVWSWTLGPLWILTPTPAWAWSVTWTLSWAAGPWSWAAGVRTGTGAPWIGSGQVGGEVRLADPGP